MQTTTKLILMCAAALAGCGGGNPFNPDHDGETHACGPDYNTQQVCISDDNLEQHPDIVGAVCDYCDANPYAGGCIAEAQGNYTCHAPDWAAVVDVNGAAVNGWECVQHGGVIFTLWDGTTSGPNPIRLQNLNAEDQGFWGVCAGGESAAAESCVDTCTDRMASILEGIGGEDYSSASFWIEAVGGWFEYTGTLTAELFCEEAFAAAYTSRYQACSTGLVTDPGMDTFVWSDGTKAPLACDLNLDCCDDVGACDATTGRLDQTVAVDAGIVTGNLHVEHMLGTDTAPITGEMRWTAPDCLNPGGACPIYLEAVDLTVSDLAGGDRVDNYLLHGLGLSLASPTMGAWRPDTGEVQFMSEVVQFRLTVDESESSDGSARGAQDLTQRPDGTLYGSLTDELLTLHATRSVNGVRVSVQVDAQSTRRQPPRQLR